MGTLLKNLRPGESDALAEFDRDERHAQDGEVGVERPVARTGLVFLPLHVACSVIADFTAAPMASDELREGLRRTGQTGAQEVGDRVLSILFLARRGFVRCVRCGRGRLSGFDLEALASGLSHGLFPDHQCTDVWQAHP